MKERPILFSGPMVLALMRDPSDPLCKVETRRVVKFLPGMQDPPLAYGGIDPPHRCDRLEECHWIGGHLAWYAEAGGCTCRKAATAIVYEGDRLWVRETFHQFAERPSLSGHGGLPENAVVDYRADYPEEPVQPDVDSYGDPLPRTRWSPSIHMPRWASRLTLSVESVRVERLHDIDDAGARREGVADREAYRALWERINGAGSWDINPWVWVVGFRRVTS